MVKSYALGAFGVIAIALLASSYADGFADNAVERRAAVAAGGPAGGLPSEWASDGSEAEAAVVVAPEQEVEVVEAFETAH